MAPALSVSISLGINSHTAWEILQDVIHGSEAFPVELTPCAKPSLSAPPTLSLLAPPSVFSVPVDSSS